MTVLTKGLQRTYRERVISPVIIMYKKNKKRDVLSVINDFLPTNMLNFGDIIKPRRGMAGNIIGRFQGSLVSLNEINLFNMLAVGLTKEAIEHLADDRNIKKIYPDRQMWALQYPVVAEDNVYATLRSDPFTTSYYTKKLIGGDRANEQGYDGAGMLAAVPDTGGDRKHPSYRGRVEYKSMMIRKGQWADKNGHGCWCEGTLGGSHTIDRTVNGGTPTEGIAPRVNMLGLKCLGYVVGTGFTSDIIASMEYSFQRDADVVSMSLGGPAPEKGEPDPMGQVITALSKTDTVFVVAAGNSGPDSHTVGSPGTCPDALTVGAYDPITGEIADFSSRGPTPEGVTKPDVVAPGVGIHAPVLGMLGRIGSKRNQRYSPLSGTSMATPATAGLVVLMKQAKRQLVGEDMDTTEIIRMCKQLGSAKNNTSGYGFMTWDWFEQWMSTEYGEEVN